MQGAGKLSRDARIATPSDGVSVREHAAGSWRGCFFFFFEGLCSLIVIMGPGGPISTESGRCSLAN